MIEEYYQTISDKQHTFNLCNLLSKHSAYMIDMAIHDREDRKRDSQKSWAKIDRINHDWITLLCPVSSHHSNYKNITTKLVKGYSNMIADYIIDGNLDKKYENKIIDAMTTYYDNISLTKNSSKRSEIKRLIKQYTYNIKAMVDILDELGKHDGFYTKARECMISASLLGSQLQNSVFN